MPSGEGIFRELFIRAPTTRVIFPKIWRPTLWVRNLIIWFSPGGGDSEGLARIEEQVEVEEVSPCKQRRVR